MRISYADFARSLREVFAPLGRTPDGKDVGLIVLEKLDALGRRADANDVGRALDEARAAVGCTPEAEARRASIAQDAHDLARGWREALGHTPDPNDAVREWSEALGRAPNANDVGRLFREASKDKLAEIYPTMLGPFRDRLEAVAEKLEQEAEKDSLEKARAQLATMTGTVANSLERLGEKSKVRERQAEAAFKLWAAYLEFEDLLSFVEVQPLRTALLTLFRNSVTCALEVGALDIASPAAKMRATEATEPGRRAASANKRARQDRLRAPVLEMRKKRPGAEPTAIAAKLQRDWRRGDPPAWCREWPADLKWPTRTTLIRDIEAIVDGQ
jgi:hypothetical protein